VSLFMTCDVRKTLISPHAGVENPFYKIFDQHIKYGKS
jgi:hypothetical protein